jgi:hypothetical protein
LALSCHHRRLQRVLLVAFFFLWALFTYLYMLLGRVATAPLSGLVTLLESSVRSYLVGNAGSRPISEAKQPWACLVLRWGTTGEAHVLYSPQISFFQVKNLTWRLYLCIFCTDSPPPLFPLPQLTTPFISSKWLRVYHHSIHFDWHRRT